MHFAQTVHICVLGQRFMTTLIMLDSGGAFLFFAVLAFFDGRFLLG